MAWLTALIKAVLEWLTAEVKKDTKAGDADTVPQSLKDRWRDRINKQLEKQNKKDEKPEDEKPEEKSEKEIRGVSGGLARMAKSAGIAAAAYLGASGLSSAIKSATEAYGKQQLAEQKLRFAAGASTEQLIKQAKALQTTTKFGDEAIIAQQAYVKSLGISTKTGPGLPVVATSKALWIVFPNSLISLTIILIFF